MVLVRCSLFGGVAFGDVGLLVVLVLLLKGVYHYNGAFSISVILLLFFGCVHPYCH
jgi:hypothetical protein